MAFNSLRTWHCCDPIGFLSRILINWLLIIIIGGLRWPQDVTWSLQCERITACTKLFAARLNDPYICFCPVLVQNFGHDWSGTASSFFIPADKILRPGRSRHVFMLFYIIFFMLVMMQYILSSSLSPSKGLIEHCRTFNLLILLSLLLLLLLFFIFFVLFLDFHKSNFQTLTCNFFFKMKTVFEDRFFLSLLNGQNSNSLLHSSKNALTWLIHATWLA